MNLTWFFVLIVYAICVLIARFPKRVALLFYALVLLFLFRPLTEDVVLAPADVIRLVPPWSELRAPNRPVVTKYEVSNLNLHDVSMQIIPWVHQVRESWKRREVPLWNDAAGAGMPLLANGQSTPFSIFHIVTLPLSLAHALAAEAALKLLLALTLTFAFCRRRSSTLASLVAAIAYGFSTWMVTWLQFPIAAAAAFLPGVFLAIDWLAESRERLVPSIAIFTLAVLSGHPETIYNIALLAAAYGIWIAKPRGIARVAMASIVAALLCLPFLVPFAEAVLQSQRFAEVSAPRATLQPPWSDFPSAILLLQPRFFGELPIERPWGPTSLESVCGFAGVLALVAVIAVAIDIIARRRWRDRDTLYILGFIACLAIILGWPVITEIFHTIAGHAPAMRMRIGLCWFGSLLIASAIDRARRDGVVPLFVATLAVAASMFWLLRITHFPTPSHRATAVLSLLPSVAVLAIVPLIRVHRAVLLLALFTFIELFATMHRWNGVAEPREFYPSTPLIASIPRTGDRIVGIGGQMYPNVNALFGLEDVRVHDPMAWYPYVEYLSRNVGWNANDYYAKWNDAESPLLDQLNVRYVITDRELPSPRFRQIYAGRDGRVYENTTAKPRFYAQSGDAQIAITRTSTSSYRLHVRATSPVPIASSIPKVPGWRVKGARKFTINEAFLGMEVEAGERDIEVAYRPRTFYVSAAIALLTLIAVIVFARRR